MAISRNGWDVYASYSHPKLVNFPWVTGKVRDGDHFVVLDYIARRIHNEVEKITKAHSWGHNPRPVRGYTNVWSEHATGTAFDFNAPKNGLNVPISRSFSKAQIARIRQIIKDVKGAARWGGEWARPDGMHIELIGGNDKVKAVANLIRAGKLPGGSVKPVQSPKPTVPPKKPTKPSNGSQWPAKALPVTAKHTTDSHNAWVKLMSDIGYKDKDLGLALQKWLRGLGFYSTKWALGGDFSKESVKALQSFLRSKGLYSTKWLIDGKRQAETVKAEIAYLNQQAKEYK